MFNKELLLMSNFEKDAATHKITIGIGATSHILGYASGDYGAISPEEIDGDGGLVINNLICIVDGSSSMLRLGLNNLIIMTKMYLIRTDSKKGLYLDTNVITSSTSSFFDTPDIDKTIGLYISETPPPIRLGRYHTVKLKDIIGGSYNVQ